MDKRGHQIFCDPLFTFFLPDNPHEKVEVCAKEDGQRSQGQEAREAPDNLDWQLWNQVQGHGGISEGKQKVMRKYQYFSGQINDANVR